jgi:hypothetical protein
MISKPQGRSTGSSWQAYVSEELGLVGGILLVDDDMVSRWEVRSWE